MSEDKGLADSIRKILAREEIKELRARYSWHGMRREWDEITRLFTKDGIFAATLPTGEVVSWQGHEEMAKMLKTHNARVFPVITNEIIEVNGDEAYATCTMMTPVGPTDDKAGFAGYYEDWLRKEDGHWRFTKRLFGSHISSLADLR